MMKQRGRDEEHGHRATYRRFPWHHHAHRGRFKGTGSLENTVSLCSTITHTHTHTPVDAHSSMIHVIRRMFFLNPEREREKEVRVVEGWRDRTGRSVADHQYKPHLFSAAARSRLVFSHRNVSRCETSGGQCSTKDSIFNS